MRFCSPALLDRPLKLLSEEDEAYLLVTALVNREEGTVSLGLQPQNESIATLSVLEDPMGDIANATVRFAVSKIYDSSCFVLYRVRHRKFGQPIDL